MSLNYEKLNKKRTISDALLFLTIYGLYYQIFILSCGALYILSPGLMSNALMKES